LDELVLFVVRSNGLIRIGVEDLAFNAASSEPKDVPIIAVRADVGAWCGRRVGKRVARVGDEVCKIY